MNQLVFKIRGNEAAKVNLICDCPASWYQRVVNYFVWVVLLFVSLIQLLWLNVLLFVSLLFWFQYEINFWLPYSTKRQLVYCFVRLNDVC